MATTTSFVKSRNVRAAIFTLGITDTTSAEMFKLPANALILDWIVNVQTAVSGGTTTLDVGTAADGSAYINTLTVSTKGKVTLTTQVKTLCITHIGVVIIKRFRKCNPHRIYFKYGILRQLSNESGKQGR